MSNTLQQQNELEAAVLRRLLEHLRLRTDVQNIDLMGWGGFCRNCLSDWLMEASEAQGQPMSKDAARKHIYGMDYEDYKSQHQTVATAEQLERMNASVAKTKAERAHFQK